ncbi:hypothetical protein WDU94_009587 [Cyamophila willieti]
MSCDNVLSSTTNRTHLHVICFTFQDRYCDVQSLALWLANASELLNFLKSDRHICAFSLEAQDSLADTVQITFR